MTLPSAPDPETREHLLDVLADLVARGGSDRFLLPPVVPGHDAFPDAWAPTRPGVEVLLRRLLWHAGIEHVVLIDDARGSAAPPTERKPATRVSAVEVRDRGALFELGFVGSDDFVGTLAHEVGIVFAAQHRPDGHDPYRTARPSVIAVDPELDHERGSIATVYLGLGVLAANAAYQQYSRGGGGYERLEYDVLRAGAVPMSALAFLLAVQAVVRGTDAPPRGLSPPQRDEVAAWIAALRDRAGELRDRLALSAGAVRDQRPLATAFADVDITDDPRPEKTAFRWQTHRGGIGLLAGAALGIGFAALVATRTLVPWVVFGGAAGGHVLGRRVRVPRCSSCATIVVPTATSCPRCGAALRGDIARLDERLDAEERL